MPPTTQMVTFGGELLRRGFWLYVWEVKRPDGSPLYYVGRTGDSSSMMAQSPFNRMGQHLGFLKSANMLRSHLKSRKVEPDICSFRLVAHGPILDEADTMELHRERRDVVAALEKELAEDMLNCGYDVMNTVKSRKDLDKERFTRIRAAFAAHFPGARGSQCHGGEYAVRRGLKRWVLWP